MYIYIYICIYICIYCTTKRSNKAHFFKLRIKLNQSITTLTVHDISFTMYTYIYTYTYICINICLYVHRLYRIVETISCALLNQEKRNRYVSKQVALMLRLQEETMHSQLQYSLQQQITTSNNMTNDNAKKLMSITSGNASNDNNGVGKKTHVISNDNISNLFATLSSGNGNSPGITLASPQRRASFVNPTSPMTGTFRNCYNGDSNQFILRLRRHRYNFDFLFDD
jgi:hypothetical protein